MKQLLLSAFALTIMIGCAQGSEVKSKVAKFKLKTELDSVSYAIGNGYSKGLKKQGLKEISPDAFAKALYDNFAGQESLLSEEQVTQVLTAYSERLKKEAEAERAVKMEAYQKRAATAKEDGEKFLAENKVKEGVQTTASGLQYKVIREGDGPNPTSTSTVKVHYRGTFTDGETFDASYDRGEPISFPLSGVIKGWTEGVQLMKKGAKYEFYIPYDLAYGPQGSPGSIPGYSTLVFVVELLDIEG